MRRIAALAALLIPLLLVHPDVAQDGSDSCPAPKVLVSVEISDAALAELRNESGEEISKNLAEKDFSIFIQELIASSSPSVIVRSSGEREEMLDDQIGRIEAGEQEGYDPSAITTYSGNEYLLGVDIDWLSYEVPAGDSDPTDYSIEDNPEGTPTKTLSFYKVTGDLVDLDVGPLLVYGVQSENPDAAETCREMVSGGGTLYSAPGLTPLFFGDIGPRIEDYEEANPVPPRAPSMEVTLTPESVSLKDGHDACTIAVRVTNCRGDAVEGTRVYFEETSGRGSIIGGGTELSVNTQMRMRLSEDYLYAITDADGIARVTWKLDASKGVKAGRDTVDIITDGRGLLNVHTKAEIPISGIILEARAEKDVLAPKQATTIRLSLFELSENAERTPLAGKMLLVDDHLLPNDAKVVVMGATDAGGNPITAADGTAELKFIAGEEERLNRIRVIYPYTGEGYPSGGNPDPVEAWVEIDVKKDEYKGTVNWKESGFLRKSFNFQGDSVRNYDYDFTMNADITKEKNTGQETTDASFRYNDNLYLYSSGRTMTCSGDSAAFEEEWDVESHLSGHVKGYETINTVIQDRYSSYTLPVTPFPVPIPASGTHAYDAWLLLKIHGAEIPFTAEGVIPAGGQVTVLGRSPETGIPVSMLLSPGDSTELFLSKVYYHNNMDMSELKDERISGYLVQTGKNIHKNQWSVSDSNSYHGLLFTLFNTYDATLDMDQSFNRQVTLTVVKL